MVPQEVANRKLDFPLCPKHQNPARNPHPKDRRVTADRTTLAPNDSRPLAPKRRYKPSSGDVRQCHVGRGPVGGLSPLSTHLSFVGRALD